MLLALPCGRDEVDVLQQSKNLQTGFIMYLQQKQAAGIVNIAAPGSQQVRRNYYYIIRENMRAQCIMYTLKILPFKSLAM